MQHDAPAKMEGQPEKKAEEEAMSPEEITKYRAVAQQNSIDAIGAAEKRYAKVKDAAAATLRGTKEAVAHGVGAAETYAVAKGAEAKDAAAHGARLAAGYTAEKGATAKDVVMEKGQKGYQAVVGAGRAAAGYTAEKGAVAKDVVVEKGQQGYEAAKEKAVGAGRAAADYTKQVATVSTGNSAAEHAKELAEKATEVTVNTGKSAAEHAKEMAEKAREVTVSTGKSTAEYVRQNAVEMKDATAGGAHKAAEYTSQKAAEAKTFADAAVQAVAPKSEAPDLEREIHGEEDHEASKTEQRLRELSVGGGDQKQPDGSHHGDSGESLYSKREEAANVRMEGEPRSLYMAGEDDDQVETSTSDVGGLFEAVGEAVISIAQTAKEMLMGREQR